MNFRKDTEGTVDRAVSSKSTAFLIAKMDIGLLNEIALSSDGFLPKTG